MGSNPTEGALQFFSLILFFLISIKRLVHLFFQTNQKMLLVKVEQNYIPHICANSPADLKKMVHPSAELLARNIVPIKRNSEVCS